MTTVIPPHAMSKLDNLVSALCTKEEISDPEMVQVNVGTKIYYCDAEAAGFVAGAASTAIAETSMELQRRSWPLRRSEDGLKTLMNGVRTLGARS